MMRCTTCVKNNRVPAPRRPPAPPPGFCDFCGIAIAPSGEIVANLHGVALALAGEIVKASSGATAMQVTLANADADAMAVVDALVEQVHPNHVRAPASPTPFAREAL